METLPFAQASTSGKSLHNPAKNLSTLAITAMGGILISLKIGVLTTMNWKLSLTITPRRHLFTRPYQRTYQLSIKIF